MRRLAEHAAEAAAEVRRREVGNRRDGTDVERLGVGAVHRIAGAEQTPVQFLDLSAHAAMLCGWERCRSARGQAPLGACGRPLGAHAAHVRFGPFTDPRAGP
ncbi:hypothetical protein GCM10028775_74390 [Catellatospora paridis]